MSIMGMAFKGSAQLFFAATLLCWCTQSHAEGTPEEIAAARAEVKEAKQNLNQARKVLRELRGIDDTDERFTVEQLDSLIDEVDAALKVKNYRLNVSMNPNSLQNFENRVAGGQTVSAGHSVFGKKATVVISRSDGSVLPSSRYKGRRVLMHSALADPNGFDQHVRCFNMSNSAIETGNVAIMSSPEVPRGRLYVGYKELYKRYGAHKLLKVLEPDLKKWNSCKKVERALYKKLASMTLQEAEEVDLTRHQFNIDLDVTQITCNWP